MPRVRPAPGPRRVAADRDLHDQAQADDLQDDADQALALFRSGRSVATGRVARGGRVRLTARRKLTPGTYVLRAVRGRSEQRVAVGVRMRW